MLPFEVATQGSLLEPLVIVIAEGGVPAGAGGTCAQLLPVHPRTSNPPGPGLVVDVIHRSPWAPIPMSNACILGPAGSVFRGAFTGTNPWFGLYRKMLPRLFAIHALPFGSTSSCSPPAGTPPGWMILSQPPDPFRRQTKPPTLLPWLSFTAVRFLPVAQIVSLASAPTPMSVAPPGGACTPTK